MASWPEQPLVRNPGLDVTWLCPDMAIRIRAESSSSRVGRGSQIREFLAVDLDLGKRQIYQDEGSG